MQMHGSVVLVRESGVHSLRVGDTYFVGYFNLGGRGLVCFCFTPYLAGVSCHCRYCAYFSSYLASNEIRSQRRLGGWE